jgi:hypothetical protein
MLCRRVLVEGHAKTLQPEEGHVYFRGQGLDAGFPDAWYPQGVVHDQRRVSSDLESASFWIHVPISHKLLYVHEARPHGNVVGGAARAAEGSGVDVSVGCRVDDDEPRPAMFW